MKSDTSPAAVAMRWFTEVWQNRDHSAIERLLHPQARGHHEGGLESCGPADFLAFYNDYTTLLPDLKITVDALLADDRQVCVRWTARGTHTGVGLGFKATGRPVVMHGMSWLTVEDGRITEGWDSWNQGDFIASLAAPVLT